MPTVTRFWVRLVGYIRGGSVIRSNLNRPFFAICLQHGHELRRRFGAIGRLLFKQAHRQVGQVIRNLSVDPLWRRRLLVLDGLQGAQN